MRYESEYYGVQSLPLEGYLQHHGIKGQKWGIRRFQNSDGSLTEAGKKRYLTSDGNLNSKGRKEKAKAYNRAYEEMNKTYQIEQNARVLAPYAKAKEDALRKSQEAYDNFFKQYKSSEYEDIVDKVISKYIDDPDLKDLVRNDLMSDNIVRRKGAGHASIFVYNEFKTRHPEVQKYDDAYMEKSKAYRAALSDIAHKSYMQAGPEVLNKVARLDEWTGALPSKFKNDEANERVLQYEIEKAVKKYSKPRK